MTASGDRSPLLAQAIEDLLAGAALTAPLTGSFVLARDFSAAPQDVTAACAVGALQVGHALRLGLRRWYAPSPGFGDEFAALLDAYHLRYRASLIVDNDLWGRDTVVARCKELAAGARPPPASDRKAG